MVSKLVRHFDQDERHTDAAVHWDTIKPVLVRGFKDHVAERFTESQWIEHIYKRSNEVGFECCETPQKASTYLRAIQGHSSGTTIAPELMGRVLLPHGWEEFINHKGCSFNKKSILEHGLVAGRKQSREGKQTVFFSPLKPCGQDDEEEPIHDGYDCSKEVSLLQQMET